MCSSADKPEPLPGESDIRDCRSLRLFPESVQHVNSIRSRRHVNDAKCAINVDAYLTNSRADAFHGLPVHRLQPLLQASKLRADRATNTQRECLYAFQRIAVPDNVLFQ